MPTRKIIYVPILPSNAFRNYSLLTHLSHTRTNLILAPAHTPTLTPPTVWHQAPAAQPSQSQPRSCHPHRYPLRPNHATPPPRLRRPTTFLFFLSSSSTLLLPLTQHHWSGRHRPPAHSTPPPNPPDLAAAVLHWLRSSLSLILSLSQSDEFVNKKSFYFDFWLR